MIQDEFFSLLSLFVLLFISIILIVISFSTKNNKTFSTKILNVGIILLDLVFYFFIKYKIIAYLFSEYRSITYFIQYFAITFMIYTAFKIAEIDVSPLFKKLCQISSQVLLLAYIVRFFLTLFGIIEMKDLYFLENIFMFYSLAIIIVTLTSSFLIDKQRIRTQEVICNIPIYILLSYIFIYHSRNKLVHLSLFVIVTIILFVYLQLRTIISEYLKILNENLHIQTYEKLINIDALTGAGSRYSLEKKLEEYRNFDSVITVMTVDVNNLKYINDNFGHIMGDEAIKSVGKYIENTIENSKVFRTGGDEYTVFCEYELEDIFLQNLNRCISLKQLDVMFSIGSCIYDSKGDISIETAIKISDNNMYKDKMRLKNIPAN